MVSPARIDPVTHPGPGIQHGLMADPDTRVSHREKAALSKCLDDEIHCRRVVGGAQQGRAWQLAPCIHVVVADVDQTQEQSAGRSLVPRLEAAVDLFCGGSDHLAYTTS